MPGNGAGVWPGCLASISTAARMRIDLLELYSVLVHDINACPDRPVKGLTTLVTIPALAENPAIASGPSSHAPRGGWVPRGK